MDWEKIKRKVKVVNDILAENPQADDPFNPPIQRDELFAFEKKHQVQLPQEYRFFISEIANGGLGLLKLNSTGEVNDFHQVWGNLDQEFHYEYQVELENQDLFRELYRNHPDYVGKFVNLRSFRENYRKKYSKEFELQCLLFDESCFYEGAQFIEELFEEYYWSSKHFDGVLLIEDYGCNIYGALIINGKSRGTIWKLDTNGNRICFYPKWKNGVRMNYIDLVSDRINEFIKLALEKQI